MCPIGRCEAADGDDESEERFITLWLDVAFPLA